MAPRASAHTALLEFTDNSGWGSKELSAMIGLLAPMAVLVGYDCSAHMSEEIRDASVTLPRAIMGSVGLNITLVFIMVITLCFTIGDQATSYAGTNVMTAIIIIIMLSACAVSEVAAASRQIWSFARDAGLPGHTWLSRVSPGWNIPLPAVAVDGCGSPLVHQYRLYGGSQRDHLAGRHRHTYLLLVLD